MITEEKWVDAESEEAKAHFNSTKIENKSQPTPSSELDSKDKPKKKHHHHKKKRKRESLLDAVINNSSKTKLSTLEKSRLDWANYVDKNKIKDELKFNNKGGYLDEQDFLSRVDNRQDSKYKDAKVKLKKQEQQQNL
ncbi:unnamed protein product [Ambrosiozyma monospora]|uniref:Unnamed protein product n=1 Tax=Ambrosiozyma monospora TaxID=43982 RepID=A0ACB5SVP3_AMBMO|nr:unnamed protein product [Ambrosiozyma monospora]